MTDQTQEKLVGALGIIVVGALLWGVRSCEMSDGTEDAKARLRCIELGGVWSEGGDTCAWSRETERKP